MINFYRVNRAINYFIYALIAVLTHILLMLILCCKILPYGTTDTKGTDLWYDCC